MTQIVSDDPKWQEWRRLRAWELSQQGWKQCEIARALDVTPGAVSQWLKRARDHGVDGLRSLAPSGPPPRLSVAQLATIPDLIRGGARAFGFPDDTWTNQRVANALEQRFQVHYHPAHISRLLRKIGVKIQHEVNHQFERRRSLADERIQRWPPSPTITER